MKLHPALARIAAQYDQVLRDFRDQRISDAEARSRVQMLQARDDTGVFWSIDPATGSWLRKTAFGEWVPGTPPEYGLAQPTAFQLTGAHDDVGSRLRFDKVDEALAHPPESIVGATRNPAVNGKGAAKKFDASALLSNRRALAAIVAVVFAALVGAFLLLSDDSAAPPAPPAAAAAGVLAPPLFEGA